MCVFPAEQEGWGNGLYNRLDAFTKVQGIYNQWYLKGRTLYCEFSSCLGFIFFKIHIA